MLAETVTKPDENSPSLADSLPPSSPTTVGGIMEASHKEASHKAGGAPRGNRNSQRGPRRGWRSQTLPADCGHVEQQGRVTRLEVEAELRAVHGDEISLFHMALVQSLIRHEQICQLAYKRLRGLPKDAATSDHASLWSIISKETDARDRCLRAMNLERASAGSSNPWAVLDSTADESTSDNTSGTSTATEGSSGQ